MDRTIATGCAALVLGGCFASSGHPAPPIENNPDAAPVVRDASADRDALPVEVDANTAEPDAELAPVDAGPPVDLPCGAGLGTWAGDLACADRTCGIVASEVATTTAFCNDTPSLVIRADGEPMVLFGTTSRTTGGIARRNAGIWTTESAPHAPIGAFVLDAAGCGYAILDTSGTLYAYEDDAFRRIVDTGVTVRSRQLAMDTTGDLHAVGDEVGAVGVEIAPSLGVSVLGRGGVGVQPGAVAIAPDGSVHRAWTDDERPGYVFHEHDGLVTPLLPTDGTGMVSGYLAWAHVDMAVVGSAGAGVPLVLFGDEMHDVHFAVGGAGGFTTTPIGSYLIPIGLVAASDGDAVGLLVRGDDWPSGPGLVLVTLHAGTVSVDPIALDVDVAAGTLALGPDGALHVAICRRDAPDQILYLRIDG